MLTNKIHIPLRQVIGLLTLAFTGFCQQSYAQSVDTVFHIDSETFLKRQYIQSSNPIGLEFWDNRKFSELAINYSKENGELRNYFHSNNSYTYAANIQSVARIDKHTVVSGQVDYSHFHGKNMGGSNFIDPYAMPFDLLDFSENTEGSKGLELYHLHGGISHRLKQDWLLGAKIDYTTGNYTKFKDLRHVNKLLDVELSLGLGKQIGRATMGLNYIHNRRVESIMHTVEGSSEGLYTSFISYGNFLGYKLLATQYGTYINLGNAMPLADIQNGVGAQVYLQLGPQILWSNEFQYHTGSGYYGDKDRIHYSKHQTTAYVYAGEVLYNLNQNAYLMNIDVNYDKLVNIENVLKEYTQGTGASYIEVIAEKEVLSREYLQGKISLSAHLNTQEQHLPKWILGIDGTYSKRDQMVTLFPNYRKQVLNMQHITGYIKRNYRKNNQLYQLKYQTGIHAGNGNKYTEGLMSSSGTSTDVVYSFDRFLNQEYEYLTATRFVNSIDLAFHTRIRSFLPFVNLQYSNQFIRKPTFIGKNRHIVQITIGTHL